MKLLSRLVIVFAICLVGLFVLSLASPVQAQGSFSLSGGSVSRGKGYMGDEVRIYGSWEIAYGGYIYIYYELYNEDEEDWPYERVRYEYYEEYETEGFYYFDCDDFEIPESCMGVHDILICNDDDPDDVLDTVKFTVYPFIEIDKTEGPVGTSVGVTGFGWHGNEARVEVRFYTKDPGTIYYDDSSYYVVAARQNIAVDDYGTWKGVTFQVPLSSKGDHWIYVVGDKADSIEVDKIKGAEFEVTPGISMSLASGYVGDSVTVTGSGFNANEVGVKVSYDGIQVGSGTIADANGAWTETFQVPESAKGVHKIDAYGNYTAATTISDKSFTVKSSATMEPTEGHVGTSLSAAGTGFAAEQVVSIKYDATEVATTTSNSKGSFSAGFSVPKSVHGKHTVTVGDASGTSFSFDFVMESTPPPKPTLMLPENNSRIGFITAVTPTFEWSAVTDPSGVVYYFQLATDAGFIGLIIPGDKELTATNYILPEQLALPYGDYYWRVKAVDGAQNDSGWTVTYSFKSGFLPLWGFIAIVAGVVVLIGVLVYFLVVRRRSFYD